MKSVKCKMESVKCCEKFLFTDEYDVEAAEMRLVDVRKVAVDEKPPAEP